MMNVCAYIAIPQDRRLRRSENKYTFMGELLFPKYPIPIIKEHEGCLGLGTVSKVVYENGNTKITFDIETDYPEEFKRSLYQLYQIQVSLEENNEDNPYGNTDQIIPGAFHASSYSPNTSNSGDYDEDDYDDDDDFDDMERFIYHNRYRR